MILPKEWLTCKRRTSLKRAGRDRSGRAPAIPRGRQAAKFKPGNHATVAELVDAQDLGFTPPYAGSGPYRGVRLFRAFQFPTRRMGRHTYGTPNRKDDDGCKPNKTEAARRHRAGRRMGEGVRAGRECGESNCD